MVIGAPPSDAVELNDAEQADLTRRGGFMKTGSAYQQIQGKNPQTLGYALNDSPAGLAGWIAEKLHAPPDHDRDPEPAATRDQIRPNLTGHCGTGTTNPPVRL